MKNQKTDSNQTPEATPETAPETPPTTTDDPTPAPEANNAADAKPEALANESDKQSKYVQRVIKANSKLHRFQQKVASAEADVEHAKGVLKKAIGDRDSAVIDLQKVIEGQQTLPGMEDAGESDPGDSGEIQSNPDTSPISDLGTKQLSSLLGADVMESSKNRDEPLGLTNQQLEKFESAGIATIADLEKVMRDKPHDWWSFLAKKADAAVVSRVLNSWREYRMKCPVAEVGGSEENKLPTILEANGVSADPETLAAGATA